MARREITHSGDDPDRVRADTKSAMTVTVTTSTCGTYFGDHQGASCTCTLPDGHPGVHLDEYAAGIKSRPDSELAALAKMREARATAMDWADEYTTELGEAS